MTKLSPIESEFAKTEQAEAHDAWVRAKVQKALSESDLPLVRLSTIERPVSSEAVVRDASEERLGLVDCRRARSVELSQVERRCLGHTSRRNIGGQRSAGLPGL